MDLHDNSERLARFRSGDRETLTEVYKTYVPKVVTMLTGGFTFSSGGEMIRFAGYRAPHQIQEAIQDIFLKAFSPAARMAYDGTRDYQPYLLQIGRNVVIDSFRRAKRDRVFVTIGKLVHEDESTEDAMGRLGLVDAESPEDLSAREEIHACVRAYVATLSSDDQQIVQHHLAGDLSQSQIAEQMGVDRNEIRRRIKSIREGLLRHLKAHGVIDTLEPQQVLQLLVIFGGLT